MEPTVLLVGAPPAVVLSVQDRKGCWALGPGLAAGLGSGGRGGRSPPLMAGGASASPGSWGSAARALRPPGQGQGPAEGSPLARFSSRSTSDKELSVSPSPPLPACLTRHFKDFPTEGLQHPAKASQHWGADFKDGLELGASRPVERPYHFGGDSPQEGPAQCRGEGRPL